MRRCPNCGGFHDSTDNGYCVVCAERLGKLTGMDHIDSDGKLSSSTVRAIQIKERNAVVPLSLVPRQSVKDSQLDFSVKVIEDSISPAGKRLTTITATYPRFVHAEVMTHRDRARNAASSRAIPWPKMRQTVMTEPVIPIAFGTEQSGMQTGGPLLGDDALKAGSIWLKARDAAVQYADMLAELGVHKALINRLIEPFAWITIVMTATEWQNFFRLRCHQDSEIHFQKIACMIRDTLQQSKPTKRMYHLPFLQDDERDLSKGIVELCKISTARCARVSYLTHEGKRDQSKDLELFDRLCQGSGFGHWSPHEHAAFANDNPRSASGPFRGWDQYRKLFPGENEQG